MATNILIYQVEDLKVDENIKSPTSMFNLQNRIAVRQLAAKTNCTVYLVTNLRLLKHDKLKMRLLLICNPDSEPVAYGNTHEIYGKTYDNIIIMARRVNELALCYNNPDYKIYTLNVQRYHTSGLPLKKPDNILTMISKHTDLNHNYESVIDDMFITKPELEKLVDEYITLDKVDEAMQDYFDDYFRVVNELICKGGNLNDSVYSPFIGIYGMLRMSYQVYKMLTKPNEPLDYEDVYRLVKSAFAQVKQYKTKNYDAYTIAQLVYANAI